MNISKIRRQPRILLRFPRLRLPVALALATIYLFWGSSYLGVAYALESYPSFLLSALRLLGCIVVLAPMLVWRGASLPSRREMISAAMLGTLMFSGAGLVALGQELGVSSGLTSVATAAVVIWATLFAGLLGHHPGKLEMTGVVIGIVGVALLNLEKGMQANPAGALALLLGPMAWALGSMISNRIAMPSGLMSVFFQMLGGFCVLILLGALRGEQIPSDPALSATAALIYLSLFPTLLGFSVFMYLVREVRPALATSYGYVNPMIAVLLGISLRAESITHIGALAMAVIISGVLLVLIGKSR